MLRKPDETALTVYWEDTYANTSSVEKTLEGYEIVQSQSLRHHYLGKTRGFNLLNLEVSLADWGVVCWKGEHLSEIIQPLLLRAPDVILEALSGLAVDIWNLGGLLPELMFGQNIFSRQSSGEYTVKGHLAEMDALLGPFSETLLSQVRLKGARKLFDDHGNNQRYRLKKMASLQSRFENLPDGESFKFEAFIRLLLTIDPQSRRAADETLRDSWLSHEYTQSIVAEKVS